MAKQFFRTDEKIQFIKDNFPEIKSGDFITKPSLIDKVAMSLIKAGYYKGPRYTDNMAASITRLIMQAQGRIPYKHLTTPRVETKKNAPNKK